MAAQATFPLRAPEGHQDQRHDDGGEKRVCAEDEKVNRLEPLRVFEMRDGLHQRVIGEVAREKDHARAERGDACRSAASASSRSESRLRVISLGLSLRTPDPVELA